MEYATFREEVKTYMEKLHPGYSLMGEKKQREFRDDEYFIEDNIAAIRKVFGNFSDSNGPEYMKDASEQERMQRAMWKAKVEIYMEKLHPGYSAMTIKQQSHFFKDEYFIENHTDAIHEAFSSFSNTDSPKYMEDASEQEMMQHAMWQVKVEKYMEILHPGYSLMNPAEQSIFLKEVEFIKKNTDAIHEAFSSFSNSDSPQYMTDASEQEIMHRVMVDIKTKEQKIEMIAIMPTAALVNALRVVPSAKANDADKMEAKELRTNLNTIADEGVEIDD